MQLRHVLRQAGPGGLGTHLGVLRRRRAAGRAVQPAQVVWGGGVSVPQGAFQCTVRTHTTKTHPLSQTSSALTFARTHKCAAVYRRHLDILLPVDDVVETTGLRSGQVLAALARGLWVEVLRVTGVEVRLQAEPLRGAKPRVPQPRLLVLRALVQHDELVLLPVAGLGVLRALRSLHAAAGLGEAGVLAAAGLGRGVGLAVGLERTLRAAHEALASRRRDPEWVVVMDEVLLRLRGVILSRVSRVLQGQRGERAFPRAEGDGLAAPLVALPPHLVVFRELPGSEGGGVKDAGGAGAHRPAVFRPDHVGAVMRRAVLVVEAALGEVGESVFGVGQLAEGERESGHGELPVQMVVGGGADPVEHV